VLLLLLTWSGAEKVQLHGFEAFEAASWCAAVSAAKRKKAKQEAAACAEAAAALAAANGGGLTPMASCPAALSMPESRPSSSDGSSPAAAGSSDGSSSDVAPDALHSTAQHDAGASVAPSAFATATASAAAAMSGCPGASLLTSAVSEPYPGPATTLVSSSSSSGGGSALGMFGLQAAGSSVPHALIEGNASGSARHISSTRHPSSHASDGSRRRSSCPGERLEEAAGAAAGRGGQGVRSRPASTSGLQQAQSMPLGSSSSGGASSSGGEREEGEGDGRGKVGRWLRRVLHLEGPWKAGVPIAGVFMGVV
jgi:hypothetical protein